MVILSKFGIRVGLELGNEAPLKKGRDCRKHNKTQLALGKIETLGTEKCAAQLEL